MDGWRVGTTGPTVRLAKQKLKAKFFYGADLDDSEVFDEKLRIALITFQTRKNVANNSGLRTDGVLDWATQVALGVVSAAEPSRKPLKGTVFTAQGTGVDMWTGYPADVARAVSDLFYFQPTGYYPAKPFPMGKSVDAGVAEMVNQIASRPGKIVLAGYSQGAMVTTKVWLHHIANPNGSLHHRMDDVVASVTWGNPHRELGVAHGNKDAGWPIPLGRGISDERLIDTPEWWFDYAHGKNSQWGSDIYTDTPDDDTGEYMTAIYRIVQKVSGAIGPNSLIEQFDELIDRPILEVIAMFRAIMYAGAFYTAKPFATMPHINYDIAPAIAYLRRVGESL